MKETSESAGGESLARLSGLAVASLLLAVPSYFCLGPVLAIPGVVCGHLALRRIRRAGGTVRGRGAARAGLLVGYLSVFIYLVVLPALLWRPVSRAFERQKEVRCMRNARAISDAFWAYVEEEQQWPYEIEQLKPYMDAPDGNVDAVWVCPVSTNRGVPSYEITYPAPPVAFGKPAHVVLIRETQARHNGRRTVVYGDGVVELE